MRWIPYFSVVLSIIPMGCSNAPIAGTMDALFPSKPTRRPATDPRDLLDRERDPLPPPQIGRDDSLPPPRGAASGGLNSLPRTEPDPPPAPRDPAPKIDPFRPRGNDDSLPPPLPAPGFLDPVGPGRN